MKLFLQKIITVFGLCAFVYHASEAQVINLHSIVSGRNGNGTGVGYTLDGTWMSQNARLKLLNPANFGSSGTYSKTINITDAYSATGSLSQVTALPYSTIFFFGSFDKLDPGTQAFTSAEVDSLYNWSKRGGKVIICSGQLTSPQTGGPPYDSRVLDLKWGFFWAFQNPGYFIPTITGTTTDIFNGPFGSITGAYQGGSLQGYFNPVNSNTKVLAENPDGKPTLIMDCSTLDLIIADVDGYTSLSNVTANPSVLNDQDKFWVNTIAFMDKLQPLPLINNNNNLLGLNASFVNYQWYHNNQPVSGATSPTYSLSQTGVYFAEVTLNGGCKFKSDSLKVTSISTVTPVGINEKKNDSVHAIIYPNPFNAFLQVDFKQEITNAQIKITDEAGREMRTQKFSGKILKIEKENLGKGVYIVNAECNGTLILKEKIIIVD
ncbi:MAG: T9SS type A sorting domain-containing protein [Bacteroidota bacterium]